MICITGCKECDGCMNCMYDSEGEWDDEEDSSNCSGNPDYI